MFCRFCGEELPENSRYCPRCGKDQGEENKTVHKDVKRERQMQKGSPVMLILIILLSMLCFRTVALKAFMGYSISVWKVIQDLIMIIILVALCVRGKICPGRIDGKALLFPPVMLALTIGEHAFLGVLHSCMGYFYGVEAQNAADCLKYSLREIFTDWNFETIWQWALLILFLMICSGSFHPQKRHAAIVILILLVWSVLMAVVMPLAAENYWGNLSMGMYSMNLMSKVFVCRYYNIAWLSQLVLYFFAVLAGEGKLGIVRTILFPVTVSVFSILFLLLIAAGLKWMPETTIFALGGGYLAGAMILLAAYLPGSADSLSRSERRG